MDPEGGVNIVFCHVFMQSHYKVWGSPSLCINPNRWHCTCVECICVNGSIWFPENNICTLGWSTWKQSKSKKKLTTTESLFSSTFYFLKWEQTKINVLWNLWVWGITFWEEQAPPPSRLTVRWARSPWSNMTWKIHLWNFQIMGWG